jgi:hypothetical protein
MPMRSHESINSYEKGAAVQPRRAYHNNAPNSEKNFVICRYNLDGALWRIA